MEERTTASGRIYSGRVINLRVDEVERPDGRRSRREIVEHPGAVGILALDGERLALVSQWRHAAGAALLEIPAGTLEPGEVPRATAERELAEEAGVAAADWEEGPSFYTAPGFCTERLTLYLATGLRPATAEHDADEELDLRWATLDEAMALVEAGEIADAKSIVGILWLARRRGGR